MISSSWNIFMPEKTVSVIIPARNEEALISRVLDAVLRAAGNPSHLSETDTEVIVVDNASADDTLGIVRQYAARYGVQWIQCQQVRAPCARNRGAKSARGRVFVFVDADTVIPPHTLNRVRHLCDAGGYQAGITWYASLEGGGRAWCWWTFWSLIRCLPIPRTKAMPALMFCTRAAFHEFGPFDERVAIGEEWPILAGLYGARSHRFIYDRTITALTSSRRMELQPFGYLRTFLRYLWAVAHVSGRLDYRDHCRHVLSQQEHVL